MIFKTHPQIISILSLFFKKHLNWLYWEGKYGRSKQCRGLPTWVGPFFYKIEINKIFLVILDGRKSQRWMFCWPPRNADADPQREEPARVVELLKRLWIVGSNRGSQLSSAAPRPAPVVLASSLGTSDSVKPNHWGVRVGHSRGPPRPNLRLTSWDDTPVRYLEYDASLTSGNWARWEIQLSDRKNQIKDLV